MAGQNPLNPELDQEQDEGQPQQQQGAVMGAPQAPTAPGGMQQVQPGAPQQQKGSGSFTNIQNFLGANKNFAQKQGGLAGKMAGKIGTQVGQAKTTLAGERQKFGETLGNIKQGAVQTKQAMEPSLGFLGSDTGTKFAQKFERDAEGNLKIKAVQPAAAQPAQATAEPTAPALTAEEAQANVRKALEMKYAGPERLGSEKELEIQKQSLNELGQATANQEGRFGLLKKFFGRPTYNAGQQRLDNLLVQGNQGQLKDLRGTRQQTAQFSGAFDKARGQALQDVAQTRGEVQEIAGQAKTRTGEVATQAEQQLARDVENRNRLIAEEQMYGEQGRNELLQALSAQGLDLNDLGIELDTRSAFGAPNLASARLAESSVANLGNLDIERANRLNALRQLSGQTNLVPVGTEEAGSDIEVGLSDEMRNRIGGSIGDIRAYAKAAQGADAFTGDEERQWRARMVKSRVDDIMNRNLDPNFLRENFGGDKEAMRRALQAYGERGSGASNLFQYERDLRDGLNSKEELVGSIRQDVGADLRRKFGFLGRNK
jgi:hypothetical protein